MLKLKRIKMWDCQEQENSSDDNTSARRLDGNSEKCGASQTLAVATISRREWSSPATLPNWSMGQKTSRDACRRQADAADTDESRRNRRSRTTASFRITQHQHRLLLFLSIIVLLPFATFAASPADETDAHDARRTTPLSVSTATTATTTTTTTSSPVDAAGWLRNGTASERRRRQPQHPGSGGDSIFMHLANRFATGNELWDSLIRDCYRRPTFSCLQKNVYVYLNEALDARDVNVTQRLKFYKNQVDFEAQLASPTEAALAEDDEGDDPAEHFHSNEIPRTGRAAVAETPIEEVTNALYGKSVKFALTHDLEIKLPEVMFDGATFRISPRSIEGNGIIAKLELMPKQEVEARLAGKILLKKIQKFFRNKVILSFLALVLIIKIIKIKLFWLLPVIIGVGAAKKLLLKFLLFLFPALSHLFKLCSYYQQTYHSTKFHHHHHLINHHHSITPAWHHAEHNPGPEIIYTQPPKGHVSAYLHGAPIHETYGPPHSHEHFDPGWENSGPGLGSEYISDINRAAQVEQANPNYFKPHTNDANEILVWGLGTTQPSSAVKQVQQPPPPAAAAAIRRQQQMLATQQQRPPPQHEQQQQQQQYNKPHATSHSFNPFISPDKPSAFGGKYRHPAYGQGQAQTQLNPVYVPPRNVVGGGGGGGGGVGVGVGLSAAQIAAQYEPMRNNAAAQEQKQQQPPPQQLSPELAAQLKEALRIQAEQRLIAQQQQILDEQPFVQDGQPLMPKNYDPFYSPILLKIDKIVEQLGVTDDLCKERLVCNMYRDPQHYSPHSNFVSAELSRDTSELQPVTTTNAAVLRFYRLIQAARDGQDQRDCQRLYPQCNINKK